MSAATACMPLVPLHGSAAMAAAEAVERRQPGAMETAKAGSEGTAVGCVVGSSLQLPGCGQPPRPRPAGVIMSARPAWRLTHRLAGQTAAPPSSLMCLAFITLHYHVYGKEDDRAGDDDGGDVMSKPRAVVQTLTCEHKPFCEGFALWRSIGRPELQELDPILSLDEFEFSAPAGFPDHPHRGFENVTYMLEGGVSYHDFSGHKGTINTGDVQWLTAGRGVVHAEMPAGQGVQRGINIWINLSAADKMVEPRYQDLASHDIPAVVGGEGDGVFVKVIAGECPGTQSPLRPRTPALCLDVALRPGARLRQPVPRGWSACAYIIHGQAAFFGTASSTVAAAARTLVVFGGDGDGVEVRAPDDDAAGRQQGARVLLVAARPHGEAVVRDGPFVMNTREEVEQAREDYRRRRNGFEMADGWTSDHVSSSVATD